MIISNENLNFNNIYTDDKLEAAAKLIIKDVLNYYWPSIYVDRFGNFSRDLIINKSVYEVYFNPKLLRDKRYISIIENNSNNDISNEDYFYLVKYLKKVILRQGTRSHERYLKIVLSQDFPDMIDLHINDYRTRYELLVDPNNFNDLFTQDWYIDDISYKTLKEILLTDFVQFIDSFNEYKFNGHYNLLLKSFSYLKYSDRKSKYLEAIEYINLDRSIIESPRNNRTYAFLVISLEIDSELKKDESLYQMIKNMVSYLNENNKPKSIPQELSIIIDNIIECI